MSDTDGASATRPDEEDPTTMTHSKEDEPDDDDPKDNPKKKKRTRKRKRKTGTTTSTEVSTTSSVDKNDVAVEVSEVVNTNDDEELQQTLYMEGIPFDCTEQQVREFFDKYNIPILELRLPTWHDSGRLKGYGHVVVPNEPDRQRALQEVSGKYLLSRYITLAPAQTSRQQSQQSFHTLNNNNNTVDSQPSKTIMVRNLSYEAQEQDVRQAIATPFRDTLADAKGGEIRIVRHSDTGRSKGFGYVEFKDVTAAQRFMEHCIEAGNGWSILQRPVQLDYDHGRIKGSFRTADRKLWHKEYHQKPKPKHKNETRNFQQKQTTNKKSKGGE